MIYKLDTHDYEKVRPLYQELDYHLTIQAVIDGICPGKIYVDDVQSPKTAFLCSAEGYFLAGTPENTEFNTALIKQIRNMGETGDTVRTGEDAINVDVFPQTWNTTLPTLFRDRAPIIEQRRKYLCTQLSANWKELLPEGYSVQHIDQQFLEQSIIQIPKHVHGWIQANWGNREHFLRHGFGCCLVHEQHVVSWSLADSVSGERCEIGIHTLPDCRRQGLATITTAATVDFAFSFGFKTIGWHCNDENTGSWKTAEKVGFTKKRDYVFSLYLFDKTTHLAETAWRCVKSKHYQEAVVLFQQVFVLKDDAPHYWYHSAAIAYAGAGDSKSALSYLQTAIDRGWQGLDFTQNCEEFVSLRNAPEWENILAAMHRKQEAKQ